MSFSRKVFTIGSYASFRMCTNDNTDMPTCHNSPIYEDSTPGLIDAAPIITLRAAGALIFGKTTTTEFASTTVGPKSRNPHDQSRTPGGSSAGSGAVVGDFQVGVITLLAILTHEMSLTQTRFLYLSGLRPEDLPLDQVLTTESMLSRYVLIHYSFPSTPHK